MTGRFSIYCAVMSALLLSTSAWSRPLHAQRTYIVHVDAPALAWSDCRLEVRLVRLLTRHDNVEILGASNLPADLPEFPRSRYDTDSLVNWGMEVGGRYLLTVEIHREELETRKSFNLPLVFHKYEVVGVVTGEVRLIDLERGKQVAAEPFTVHQRGPRIFQATMDDDINDPDLHLTALDKVRFFDRLEEKAAQYVVNWVQKQTRLR